MNASTRVTETIVPDSSPLDDRAYRAFTLPNGLRVLLVSDPTSDKAAAAMDISVGTFSDPSDLPGLAHFCEHMLFLGTEKYPDEASYSQYLAEKGGYSNAFTSHENTNFHFQLMVTKNGTDSLLEQFVMENDISGGLNGDIAADELEANGGNEVTADLLSKIQSLQVVEPVNGVTQEDVGGVDAAAADDKIAESPLYEALSRFSQFFIAPLFTEGATQRELNAVDSEHQKNVQNDGQRMYQLYQSCSSKRHPFSRFGTGSKTTLWDEPQARGIDTRSALLDFHNKYYSANRMNLCITGPHSLDTMQQWAEELFSPIRNSNIEHPSTEYSSEPPLTEAEMGRIIHVVPIKDIRLIELSWLIPPIKDSYRTKPAHYLAHLLGHEGKGSLLSLLKAKGWVDGLSAGPSTNTERFSLFDVQLFLTKEGMNHVDEIIEMVFGFIRLVEEKGVQKWIFEESVALNEMSFRFSERDEPFNLVQRLSSQMSMYPAKEYLSGPYKIHEFNPNEILQMLKLLSPERVNLMVTSKSAEGHTDCIEQWYGTAYRVENVPESKLASWRQISPDPTLAIPEPNRFIPTDFSLVSEERPSNEYDCEGPACLIQNDKVELYHKLDRTFKRPKAAVSLKLVSQVGYSSPRHSVLSNMFVSLVCDGLNEFAYDAEVAGLRYSLKCMTYGILITVSGYNDRLNLLTTAIIEKIASFQVNVDRFEMIKDQWERQWTNFDKEQPYHHSIYNLSNLLETPRWHVRDYVSCIQDGSVTVDSVNDFVPRLLDRMFCVMLVHGNVTEKWSRDLCDEVSEKLSFGSLPKAEHPIRRVAQVPTDFEVVTRHSGPNKEDSNSAIHVCYQVGPRGNFVTDVRLELLAEIMNKPAFHELRTKQQLGYMLWVGVDAAENVRGIYIIIQSTIADPDELNRRIEAFLVQFRAETLAALTEVEFDGFVQSMIAFKSERDKRLSDRTSRFWSEISSGDMLFNRAELEIQALKDLKKSHIIEFYDRFIAVAAPERRKVSSFIYGCAHKMPETVSAEASDGVHSKPVRVVTDPIGFRLSMPLYPASGRHKAFL